ncbi:BnaC08g41170D [Brassica napus]|uniref:BnaC08g41170D protein n=1 Tax=Brassica napus TaxID=3708 RepID=A0A078FSC1_BRANA|nr:BnaC08g41170D [Brassica napus]
MRTTFVVGGARCICRVRLRHRFNNFESKPTLIIGI